MEFQELGSLGRGWTTLLACLACLPLARRRNRPSRELPICAARPTKLACFAQYHPPQKHPEPNLEQV